MSLYTMFAANCLFPLHERIKGHTTSDVFREMEQSQWLSPAEMQALQLRRLRDFLSKIGQTVPYYRGLFESLGFEPGQMAAVEDLRRLPLMGKAEIREHTEELRANFASGLQRFNTGGSTGEPLIFYLGKERVSHDVAAKRRATRWWDVDIGDPEIVVWGSPIELGAQDRVRQFRDALLRTQLLSAFEMSVEKLDDFVAAIRKSRPRMLFGYPSSLAHIAKHALARGTAMDDLGIRVVFVTSEKLYDHQRETIEQVFGCPVANGYGGRDAGFIAHQCPSGSMHITAEDIVVEVIDRNGEPVPDGESGEIVVTHMATSEFPFVRYRTGDVGVKSPDPCSCCRGLPVLAEIQGRSTDFIVAQDGTVLHGLALIYVMRDLPGVVEFKIIQESLSAITVQIVVGEGFDRDYERQITETFRRRLGESVTVKFEYLTEIRKEISGKFRYIISRVDPAQPGQSIEQDG